MDHGVELEGAASYAEKFSMLPGVDSVLPALRGNQMRPSSSRSASESLFIDRPEFE
jgi:hypothetical protein